jgi:hypothetical protein
MERRELLASYPRGGEALAQTRKRLRQVAARADDAAFALALRSTPEGRAILRRATSVFGSEAAVRFWMGQPAFGLSGILPSDLIVTIAGRETVLELLERLDFGVYS